MFANMVSLTISEWPLPCTSPLGCVEYVVVIFTSNTTHGTEELGSKDARKSQRNASFFNFGFIKFATIVALGFPANSMDE